MAVVRSIQRCNTPFFEYHYCWLLTVYKLTYFIVCFIDSRWNGNPKLEMLKAFFILVKSKFLLMVVFFNDLWLAVRNRRLPPHGTDFSFVYKVGFELKDTAIPQAESGPGRRSWQQKWPAYMKHCPIAKQIKYWNVRLQTHAWYTFLFKDRESS